MLKKKVKIALVVGIAVLVVAGVLLTYFLVTRSNSINRISVKSYDGEVEFSIDNTEKAISDVEENKNDFFACKKLYYKDKEKLIAQVKKNDAYQRTFEYLKDGAVARTELIFLSEQYYFVISFDEGQGYATMGSLYASISVPSIYPIFNGTISVPFGDMGDEGQSDGAKTFTIDEFNSSHSLRMKENAFTAYEELKSYYTGMRSELYQCNDDTKTIGVKLYDHYTLKNGTHYYDGYPVSIRFTEENTVVISYDLDVIYAG